MDVSKRTTKLHIILSGVISLFRLLDRYTLRPVRLWRAFPNTLFEAGAYATADCKFEEGVIIHSDAILSHTSLARYSYVATGTRLHGCTIGAFCSIGPWVRAGLGRHPSRQFVSTHPAFFSRHGQSQVMFATDIKFDEFAPIQIGSDVWIGAGAILADGIIIGDGAIIGAGAVVTKDVDPFTIVGGVPARTIRKRFSEDQIDFLQKLQWWWRDIEWLQAHGQFFSDVDLLRSVVERTGRQQ